MLNIIKTTPHRLLFVTIDNMTSYLWNRGELELEHVFVSTEASLKEFAHYAAKHQNSLFSILADIPDEQFQKETIPFIRGGDRAKLLKRKRSQVFYATRFTLAESIDREKTGRKDENVLLMALTRATHFDPWITILTQTECQLTGIYSVPQLVDRLITTEKEYLLVSITKGGLRQTFIKHGKLRFSRQTLLSSDDATEIADVIVAETATLYQYLANQQLLTPGVPVSVAILAHENIKDILAEKCIDTAGVTFKVLDIVQHAKKIGLKSVPHDSNSELVFLHLLAKKLPKNQFLFGPERLYYHFWQMRAVSIAASVIFALGCVSWAGVQMARSIQYDADTGTLVQENRVDQRRYDSLMATLPPVPISNNALHNLIEKYDIVKKNSPSLEQTYEEISIALATEQRIEFSKIDWQVTTQEEPGQMYVTADIYGELPTSMFSEHRGLLDTINAFVGRLKQLKDVQVKVTSMPFDVESSRTLKSDAPQTATMPAPKFSVRVTRKLTQ